MENEDLIRDLIDLLREQQKITSDLLARMTIRDVNQTSSEPQNLQEIKGANYGHSWSDVKRRMEQRYAHPMEGHWRNKIREVEKETGLDSIKEKGDSDASEVREAVQVHGNDGEQSSSTSEGSNIQEGGEGIRDKDIA